MHLITLTTRLQKLAKGLHESNGDLVGMNEDVKEGLLFGFNFKAVLHTGFKRRNGFDIKA